MYFTPYLYIAIGETQAYFTLRETYLYKHWSGGIMTTEVRSFHRQNLAQDAEEAHSKALLIASQMGLELNTSLEEMKEEMRDIKRASAEELAYRESLRRAEEEMREKRRAEELENKLSMIAEGVFPFGEWVEKKFQEAPRDYLTWMVDKIEEFEEGTIVQLTAIAIKNTCSDLLLPKPHPTLIVGEPKQRLDFSATVIRSAYYDTDYWGRVYITTMVEHHTGACLVVKSGTFNPRVCRELTFKATIKEHSEYNGQAQTVIQRVKELNK